MIADRELETWLVVDVSASLDFGTAGCEKRDLAVAAAAAITFLNSGGGNRIGAVVANGETTAGACAVRADARAGDAARHRHHAEGPDGVRGDLAVAIDALRRPERRRGMARASPTRYAPESTRSSTASSSPNRPPLRCEPRARFCVPRWRRTGCWPPTRVSSGPARSQISTWSTTDRSMTCPGRDVRARLCVPDGRTARRRTFGNRPPSDSSAGPQARSRLAVSAFSAVSTSRGP